MAKNGSQADGLTKFFSLAGLLFLVFVLGIAFAHFKWYPYPFFNDAFVAGEALVEKATINKDVDTLRFTTNAWSKRRFDPSGVTAYDKEKAYDGVTLYSSGAGSEAFLIDMEGKALHKWAKPFYEVWPDPVHISMPVNEKLIHWRAVKLFANGDLLAVYEGMSDTPYGYGLVKLDRDSNVVWKYSVRTHHDIAFGDDGQILTFSHEFQQDPGAGLDYIKVPLLVDYLVVLNSSGKELRRYSLLEAFRQSYYSGLVYAFNSSQQKEFDRIHANSVKLVDERIAKAFGLATRGQYLLSIRNMNVVALLDDETGKITWATRGVWFWQHDIDVLDNGAFLLFDNMGGLPLNNASRVIEIDPATLEIAWEYHGEKDRLLYSRVRGGQQRLANGNTMIIESDSGRIVEVDADKRIVWEYICPIREGENLQYQAVVTDAIRYDRDKLSFLDN